MGENKAKDLLQWLDQKIITRRNKNRSKWNLHRYSSMNKWEARLPKNFPYENSFNGSGSPGGGITEIETNERHKNSDE